MVRLGRGANRSAPLCCMPAVAELSSAAMSAMAPSLDSLRSSFRGALITPVDSSYEKARRVWNGLIDKRPAVIAQCAGTADVMATVKFARDLGLPLAVRCGGHS